MEEIKNSRSKNNVLWIFLILTLVVLGLEFLIYQIEQKRIIEDEHKNLTFIAQREERNLLDWYYTHKNFAENLYNSVILRDLVKSISNNPRDARLQLFLDDYFQKEAFEKHFLTVILYDTSLNYIYAYKKIYYNISSFTRTKLLELENDNLFYISRVIRRKHPIYENPIPVIEFTVLVNTSNPRSKLFLTFVIDARKSIFSLLNTYSNQKNTMESLLLTEENNDAIYLNDLRFLFTNEIELRAKDGADQIPGKKISVSRKGISEGLDYRGEKVYAHITYIPQLHWFLVIKIDVKEVLIGTNKVLYTISGSIILILFLFIVLFGVLWRKEEFEKIRQELELQKLQSLINQKYQIISKYANDAFLLINKNGLIIEANDKAVDMYGYSVNELKGKPYTHLESDATRRDFDELLSKISKEGSDLFESIHIDKYGKEFFVEISAKIISIENELFVVSIIRNIDDRKRAEFELQESEKIFHSLFEHAYDSILLLKEGIITNCNSKALSLFKCEKEQIINLHIKELFSEEDNEVIISFLTNLTNNENVQQTYNLKLRRFDGNVFWGELNFSSIEVKEEKVTQLFIRDVTERKQFLEHLEKFKNAFANTDEMMMITDKNGFIEYVNPAFERITGYTLEEIKNKQPSILKSGHHPEEFYRNMWNTILAGRSWQGLIVNRRKDGKEYTEEMIISPIKDEKGEIISFVAVKKDVTERIKAEEVLKLAKIKAEESDRIKTNFLSMMSHEVRTPLTVILGFLDIIKSSISEDAFPEKEHIFGIIERNSKRLMTLINDIIDISRIESNEMKLQLETLPLLPMLMKITAEFEMEARAKGLRIIEDFDVDDVYVNVDENRFHQIMANLFSNAVKFTSHGEITLSAKRDDKKVYVSLKDTGIGIPSEFIPHLFEFFRQAEEGYSRNFEGAGLGLAITKKLVNLMKGEIYVESEYGKGTKFTVVFDIAPDKKEQVSHEKEILEKESPSITIEPISEEPFVLIVEDNKDNSYYVEVILSKLGLNYLSAFDSNSAFDVLKTKKVDLILMDISLAGRSLSGEDILKIIKQNPAYKNIPIIAMTAHAMFGDKEHFLQIGFDDYIAKPFTFDQLTQVLFKYLKRTN